MTSHNRGFGLVEIMVGLVIGLVCMLVIMQFSAVFENQKRATTTGSDAQTNGAMALYMMEREVRAAGNGMSEGQPQNYPPLAGCATNINSAASYLIPNSDPSANSIVRAAVSNVRLAPVVVSDGGGGRSDSLTISYGTSSISAPYTLNEAYAPGSGGITLASTAGIRASDMVALIERDPALTVNGNYITPTTCSLLQVTGAPTASVVPVPIPDVNGLGFTDEARLYNLGQFNLVTYRISANNLVADVTRLGVVPDGGAGTPVVNRTDFSPLASNIVNMQVQYGIDTGNPGGANLENCKVTPPAPTLTTADADAVVDAWVEPTVAWANNGVNLPSLFNLRRVRAVRIALVARVGVKEENPGGEANCTTTTVAPSISWDAGPAMAPDLTVDPGWQCYRYKVFQTTIPVRNALWSSTMNPASAASCGLRDPA